MEFLIFNFKFLILALFGASVGSFLNVVIDRLPTGRSLLGRSQADCCGQKLGVWDLIPLLSFVFSRGRCRYCGQPVSFYYPLVELTAAVLTAATFVYFPFPTSLFYLVNFYFLIVYFFMDLKYGLVSVPIVVLNFLVIVLYLSYLIFTGHLVTSSLLLTALAVVGVVVFFVFLILLTRGRGMGQGDVLMVFVFSLLTRFPDLLVMVFFSFVLGGIFSSLLLLAGKKKLGQTVPFGPFLVLGTLVAIFFGQRLLDLYWGYL